MSAPILSAAFSAFSPAHADDNGPRLSSLGEMIGFVAGTRIATPMGYVAAERLSAGDLVLSADGRHVRIASVEITHVETVTADTAPVCFAVGSMDNMRALRVGQGHRLRIAGWRAELMFEAEAVLAPATAFVNGETIVIEDQAGPLSYVNLMFDGHEVILAENVACETVCPEENDRARMGALRDAVPFVAKGARPQPVPGPVLPVVSLAEARMLLAA
jgi:hypothetical protein